MMLWELVQPGAGGSLRGAVGLCLQPGPFQSVSGWSHGRLVYQMCPWQSPMRVWHFQEPRQVERRTEANRKEFSLNRASWNDLQQAQTVNGVA